ncbi:MAG: site-specific integrase, partial [Cyanobacteria bacterium J06627_8]
MPETPANRVKAQEIVFQAEKDIDYGEFDPTYRKYKAQAGLSTVEDVATLSASFISLRDLWHEYVEIRKVGKAPGTTRMYGWV